MLVKTDDALVRKELKRVLELWIGDNRTLARTNGICDYWLSRSTIKEYLKTLVQVDHFAFRAPNGTGVYPFNNYGFEGFELETQGCACKSNPYRIAFVKALIEELKDD